MWAIGVHIIVKNYAYTSIFWELYYDQEPKELGYTYHLLSNWSSPTGFSHCRGRQKRQARQDCTSWHCLFRCLRRGTEKSSERAGEKQWEAPIEAAGGTTELEPIKILKLCITIIYSKISIMRSLFFGL